MYLRGKALRCVYAMSNHVRKAVRCGAVQCGGRLRRGVAPRMDGSGLLFRPKTQLQ